jgi:hypothetical protein
MKTCYIPAFTRRNGRKQETACRRWILPHEHSDNPTCPDCAAYVAAELADDRTPDDAFGREAPGQAVPYVDYDPITGDDLY